jgi:Ca-activated chloride channel family protein
MCWIVFMMVQSAPSLRAQSSVSLRLEKGTKLALDLDTPVNSATTREGDPVLFLARNDIKVHGAVAIQQGTPVKGTVTQVRPAFVNGKPKKAEVHIQLDGLSLNDGSMLTLKAEELVLKAETTGHSVTGTVLQGSTGAAMTGGLLGRVIGGSAGASTIGAVAAIGVSTIDTSRQPHVRGSDVDLPREAIFETKLEHFLDIENPALLASIPSSAATHPLPVSSPARVFPDASLIPSVHSTSAVEPSDVLPPARGSAGTSSPGVLTRNDGNVPSPASLPVLIPVAASPIDTANTFTMSLDVNRVLVDAVVRDRAGNQLTNLRKEDFRLFEDGVEREIRDFSRNELPLAVALVIDQSGSVAPMMNRIQNAAFQALQQLKSDDEVCLITFASDVELMEELTSDRARVSSRIGTIRAGGGTAIVDALNQAFRYLAHTAPERRRAVILISDNVEGHSRESLNDVLQVASETDAVLYSVKIGQSSSVFQPNLGGLSIPGFPLPGIPLPGAPALNPIFDPVPTIARETGGEVFATNANTLDAALATAIARLKLRYTLSYVPTNNSSGDYHAIKVSLVDRFGKPGSEYTVHSRSGYFGGSLRAAAAQ